MEYHPPVAWRHVDSTVSNHVYCTCEMGNEYVKSKSGQKHGEMVIYEVRDKDVFNSWIWRASWLGAIFRPVTTLSLSIKTQKHQWNKLEMEGNLIVRGKR